MTMSDLFVALSEAVTRTASAFHANLIVEYPNESIYGLVLYTDNDALSLFYRASSVESVLRHYRHHGIEFDPETDTLWDAAGWEYEGAGGDAERILNRIWRKRNDAMPSCSWEVIHGRVFQAMFQGLKDFAQPEVLMKNGQRGRLITYIFIGDPDKEMEPQLEMWARQLNPEAKDTWFHRVVE
jgi:uncharacterized protein DUF4303